MTFASRSMFSMLRKTVPFLHGLREDVITLQNTHGLPSASVSTAKTSATQKENVVAPVKPAAAGPVSATQKEAVPCPFRHIFPYSPADCPGSGNISPYSSGASGASLTSTSVDPQTVTSRLVWDEVRIHDIVTLFVSSPA
jgi:peptidyl-prolyl cis-trans isomerase-like protein 2